ncbi:MAG TPA: AAA family ATPase [Thermoanaerobaculia bacterium]|nr:AAA family ATPase [Thermoanaerobaculia bacterium]
MATVVVLNGTSSSGKTSIARAFQEAAPSLYLNFSIDSILYALPLSALDRITAGADLSDLNTPELVRAYYACVRQLLDLGHPLIIDNAITTRYQAEQLVAAVASHHVVMVGLDCPPEILTERERIRGDRRKGMAAAQQPRIHSWLSYDLTIDTSQISAQDAAREILHAIETGTSEAFERTRVALMHRESRPSP